MKLIVYSKALYATWLYYSPDRILFDAGEGVSNVLGNKVFAIQDIFLSHGHADHITGLIGLVNIRNTAMGDTKKPLTVYYPQGSRRVEELAAYIGRTNPRLQYELRWQPVAAGKRIQVFAGQLDRYVEPFPTRHSRREPSLGYNIVEVRKRLKPEYQQLTQEEIKALVREQGREVLTTTYPQKLFSYGGDSAPIEPQQITETEILCHEATFLDDRDREGDNHSTLAEAIETASQAGVKLELYVIHVSGRYRQQLARVQEQTEETARKLGLPFQVRLVPPGKVCRYE
jgi:ribonuclease Z